MCHLSAINGTFGILSPNTKKRVTIMQLLAQLVTTYSIGEARDYFATFGTRGRV